MKRWSTMIMVMVLFTFSIIGCQSNESGDGDGSNGRWVEECDSLTVEEMEFILNFYGETPPFTSGVLVDEDYRTGHSVTIIYTDTGELSGEVCSGYLSYGSPILDLLFPPHRPIN